MSAGEEEGAELLRCQFSPRMWSPGGVVEGGLLPARTAILGPESNQIRRSPQSPQQLRRTAVQAEGAERLEPRFLPPTDLSGLPGGVGCKGRGKRKGKGFVWSQKPGLHSCALPPPELCYLGVETGLCGPGFEGLQRTGRSPQKLFPAPNPPLSPHVPRPRQSLPEVPAQLHPPLLQEALPVFS